MLFLKWRQYAHKSISEKQLAANRANAARSTGRTT